MPIQSLRIFVDDIAAVLAVYNRIQVWRSPDKEGDPTPYVEITDSSASAAVLDGNVEATWNLSGLSLSIIVDGADAESVTFTGSNPFDLATVIEQINDVIPALASEVPTDTNLLRLTSPTTGTGSGIQVSGSAVSVLGLSTAKINGKAARFIIVSGTNEYTFQDLDGLDSYWYKTRFSSSSSNAVSTFSSPAQGAPQLVVPSSELIHCVANLMDGAGRPIIGRRVIFVPTNHVLVTVSGDVLGSLPSVDRIEALSDESGHIGIDLLKGQRFKVFFEGTTIQREFTVPSSGDEFNLLTVLSTTPDPFNIVQAPPMPIRVS